MCTCCSHDSPYGGNAKMAATVHSLITMQIYSMYDAFEKEYGVTDLEK